MGVAAAALGTGAAGNDRIDDHLAADQIGLATRRHLDDFTTKLVTQYQWRSPARTALLERFKFAAANSTGGR